ncbi:fungal-specific transcription factor domain-containing protein [Tricladium varicosporioides]|nr:fungal-specific transcription factor domain-containing protein [Hymenoscyphus varicosporioides]
MESRVMLPDPASARKRVSQACKLCSLKKIKCDGEVPRCSPCVKRNEECSYGVSKRRRITQNPSFESSGDISREDTARSLLAISSQHNADFIPVNNPPKYHATTLPTRTKITVSPEIANRLFQTFFDSIHPMWPLLYKPLYTSLDYTYPSPGIPAPLVLAIFAIASCVDRARVPGPNGANGSQGSGSYPKPKVFFEEALSLLGQGPGQEDNRHPVNALNPSIANCQVLVILALQQHGVAEYPRAAILCGLAASMAIELQLHRAYDGGDPTEREIRSRLWWNLYILEKMLSGEMGRPVILRYEDTDCAWPQISESDEFELMPLNSHYQKSPAHARSIKMRTMSALHTTISLSIIMERIYRQIYGLAARKAIRDDQATGDRIRTQLWRELQDWGREMDDSALKLDLTDELTSVPAAITNYVIMWTGTIMLHRPFIARWRSDLNDSSPNPFDICLDAATKMCSVLERYLERLPGGPCDMVFSIFIAASILLHHSKQVEGDAAAETRHRLKLCIHWLSVLGKSWKSAGARHQLLNDLFDLPKALQEPQLDATGALPAANGGPLGQPKLENAMPPGAGGAPLPGVSAEDWSFLRDFGDSSDQFFAWDVELRDLLDAQYVLPAQTFA